MTADARATSAVISSPAPSLLQLDHRIIHGR